MKLSDDADRFITRPPAHEGPAVAGTPIETPAHLVVYLERLDALPITPKQLRAARHFLERFNAAELPKAWLCVRRMLGMPVQGDSSHA